MADSYSPQLENGYTRIAHEWLEALMRSKYPGSVKDFLLAVARETWGYQSKAAPITTARLCALLGVTRSRVYQLRDDCLRHNLIMVEDGEHSDVPVYSLQKHYLDWIEWHTKRKMTSKDVQRLVDSTAPGVQSTAECTSGVQRPVDTGCTAPGGHNKDKGKILKDSTSKAHAPPAGDAPPAPAPDANHSPAPSPSEPKPPREDTPEQACIRRAWEALGQVGPPSGKGYSGLMKLVKEHGIPAVDEWATHLRASPATIPEGADPWAWFCRAFRDALKRPWEWQRKNGGNGNGDDYRFSDSYRGELPISEVDVTQLTPDGRGGYLF